MKIAVTGGSGFIGTRLIQELVNDGHETQIIDIADADPVDILDLPLLQNRIAGCDVIVHLAAAHRDDIFPRSEYYDVNVQGTKNVVAAAVANDINKIVFTSSVAVYPLNTPYASERSQVQPFNDYGKSKLAAEEVLKSWADESDQRSASIIRPVVVFGENNRGNVHNLISQIISGKFIMIGSGSNPKSMAYVGNIANFIKCQISNSDNYSTFNYADKPDFNMRHLTSLIHQEAGKKESKIKIPYSIGMAIAFCFDVLAKISGKTFPISSIRIKKFCADTSVNAEKAHEYDTSAKISLSVGVKRMIDHDFK